MEENQKRSENRMKNKKKQVTILIVAIAVLLVLITTVVAKTIVDRKAEEVYAKQNKIVESDSMNFINLIESNTIQENIIEENVIANEEKNEIKDENKDTGKNKGGTRYRLEVNCTQNVVNVYEKDSNGEYTNCVKVMLCSIGSATPRSGTYSLKKYGGWEWKGLQGDVYGQYATQITGNILFHSVPYTEKYNPASLEWWEYDKLGTAASLGCIRLTVRNAKWIYDNCASGTKVMFYNDSNPGPLGKPSERKISGEEAYRAWDPTDPRAENPWRNYGKEEPPVNEEVPPANEEQPPVNEEQPPVNEEQPPVNEEVPPVNEEQPPVNEEVPPVNGEEPPTNGEENPGNNDEL